MKSGTSSSRIRAWLRLALGLAMLMGFAYLLTFGDKLPGAAGEVLRHNRRHGIDATPLFYTEVEGSPHADYSGLFID